MKLHANFQGNPLFLATKQHLINSCLVKNEMLDTCLLLVRMFVICWFVFKKIAALHCSWQLSPSVNMDDYLLWGLCSKSNPLVFCSVTVLQLMGLTWAPLFRLFTWNIIWGILIGWSWSGAWQPRNVHWCTLYNLRQVAELVASEFFEQGDMEKETLKIQPMVSYQYSWSLWLIHSQ